MAMKKTSMTDIFRLNNEQRIFFNSGQTLPYEFRVQALETLKKAVLKYKDDTLAALSKDLRKSRIEGYVTEVAFVLSELDHSIKNLRKWIKPRRVPVPPILKPGKGIVYTEPHGLALIMGPWNYPFQLIMAPLVSALAAGNCATIKPSELSAETSMVIKAMINEFFDPAYVNVHTGGVDLSQALLKNKWDYIFFTGSTGIGKLVMKAAAENLTPVTLELGGKSPCIVDESADLKVTARRIAYGKFLNAGQTCIAPDYVLVHSKIKDSFLAELKSVINEFYGPDSEKSRDYGRIINENHFNRLVKLMPKKNTYFGGTYNKKTKFISPTILSDIGWDDPAMQDEIFGPILPVLEYSDIDDAIKKINARPRPLALYLFSKDKSMHDKIIRKTRSGGIGINDTVNQIVPHELPFGGTGDSGMGVYHGKAGFNAFSRERSALVKPFYFDFKSRYAPYRIKPSLVEKVMKYLIR